MGYSSDLLVLDNEDEVPHNFLSPLYHKYLLKPDSERDTIVLESKEYVQIKGYLNRIDYVASLDRKEV